MSNREFTATRTMLANGFATAGAELLDYMGTAAALAAIPNTNPPRYVVAGTLAMIAKVLPSADVPAAATVLTDERIDELCKPWVGLGGVENQYAFARAIEREVLAQAGVTAEPAEPVETAELNALREENDKLREALGDSALAATMLHKLSVENGGINAVYSGGAAQLLAEALGKQFTESGAENYLEVGFNTSTGVRLLVTLQRCDGKTPATFRREAEEKLAEAVSEIERLRVAAQVPAAEVRAQAQTEKAEQGKFAERLYGPTPSVDERRDALYTMALIFAAAESDSSREACFEDMYREFLAVPRMSIFGSLTRHTGAEISTNYTFETEEFFEVEAVERVLAQQSTADKASEVRAAEWQPIETAPKDGRAILLSRPDAGGAWIGKYEPVYGSGYRPDNPWFSLMLNRGYLPKPIKSSIPTHWMPLPAAPSTADSANTGALGDTGGDRA